MKHASSQPARQLSLFAGSAEELRAPPAAQQDLSRDPVGGVDTPSVRVRRNARARRLILRVHPRGTVEIVAPRRTPLHEIDSFVAEHRAWIERTRRSFAALYPADAFALPDQIELAALGERWRVDYRAGRGRLRLVERPGSSPADWVLRVTGSLAEEDRIFAGLQRWLRRRAQAHFESVVPPLAARMGATVTRLQVRNQKTRWGSFSSSGTLSLNVGTLFVRAALVRYLCVHELAHFHHMDHSPAFWAMVARFEPDYRALDRELGQARDAMPAWLGAE